MKPLRFACMFFYASILVFLTSCGGGGEKTNTTDSTSTKDTSATSTTASTNTTITTPENMMVVTHKVMNYEKWKAAYDSHDSARSANGLHNYVIARGVKDSNMLLVALKADDMNKAKAFAKDPGLKASMKKGGVTGAPSISFVTMVFQDTSNVSTDLRSRSMLKVKDWSAWQQAFESADAKQQRQDNGLMVRAYGHDVDNDHNVQVVLAITDSAKAFAYWKSDMFKKRIAASGVIGQPDRFIFRVVQRY